MRRKVHFIASAAALAAEKDWIFLRGEERRGEEKRVCVGGEGWDRGRRRDGDSEDGFSLLFFPLFFEGGSEEWGKRRSK